MPPCVSKWCPQHLHRRVVTAALVVLNALSVDSECRWHSGCTALCPPMWPPAISLTPAGAGMCRHAIADDKCLSHAVQLAHSKGATVDVSTSCPTTMSCTTSIIANHRQAGSLMSPPPPPHIPSVLLHCSQHLVAVWVVVCRRACRLPYRRPEGGALAEAEGIQRGRSTFTFAARAPCDVGG